MATAHYRDDLLHGHVVSIQDGQRVAELAYRDGLAHGAYRRLIHDGTYMIDGATWEEGSFSAGLPCDVLRISDEEGKVLFERDFGAAPSTDDVIAPSYRPKDMDAAECNRASSWFRHARELFADQRVAEALATMARGVGAGGNPEILRATLARVSAPVTVDEAERRATAVRATGSSRVLLAALLRGAEPSAVLRRLALLTLDEASSAFLHAAVALHEWPLSPILARALRNLDEPSASAQSVLDDVQALAMSHDEDAGVLRALAGRKQPATASGSSAKEDRSERPTIRRSAAGRAALAPARM